MASKPEESRFKQHGHAVRAMAKSAAGKKVLDYLVKEAGFYDTIGSKDQKAQNDNVAVRDFIVEHIVKPMNK